MSLSFMDQWRLIEANPVLSEQQRQDSFFQLASSIVHSTDLTTSDDVHNYTDSSIRQQSHLLSTAALAPRAHKKLRLRGQSRSNWELDSHTAVNCRCDPTQHHSCHAHPANAHMATKAIIVLGFPHFPTDILFQIFGLLDAHSLLLVSSICKEWHSIVCAFDMTYWRSLCKRTWGIITNSLMASSWKELYMMHDNIHKCGDGLNSNRYLFASFKNKFQILPDTPNPETASSKNPKITQSQKHTPSQRSNLFAWPTNPQLTYTVAISGDVICWVNAMAYSTDLNVSIFGAHHTTIENSASFSTPQSHTLASTLPGAYPSSASTSLVGAVDIVPPAAEPLTFGLPSTPFVKPQHVLRGHTRPVSLVLANHDGNFVSFDDSSAIFVWRISDFTEHSRINPIEQLGVIHSMNVHKRHIVGGGHSGKVVVWNMDTTDVIAIFSVPDQYIGTISPTELLNVSIWDDYVVCGLYDGTFYVHSIKSKKLVYTLSNTNVPRTLQNGLNSVVQDLAATAEPIAAETIVPAPVSSIQTSEPHFSTYTGTGAPNGIETVADALGEAGTIPVESHVGSGTTLTLLHDATAALVTEPIAAPIQVMQPVHAVTHIPPAPVLIPPPLILPQRTSHVPMTLAMNGHILITNGAHHNEIAVWDMTTGKPLYTLSESIALARDGYSIPDYREIRFAELSHCGSCMFSSVAFEGNLAMLVWDFRLKKTCKRVFSKLVLDEHAQIEVWICEESC
ncbi:hypothetical protein BDV3_002441 [Batrachochytrium dendrobatidis]